MSSDFPSCEEGGARRELMATFFARTTKGGGRATWPCLCSWRLGAVGEPDVLTALALTDSRRGKENSSWSP